MNEQTSSRIEVDSYVQNSGGLHTRPETGGHTYLSGVDAVRPRRARHAVSPIFQRVGPFRAHLRRASRARAVVSRRARLARGGVAVAVRAGGAPGRLRGLVGALVADRTGLAYLLRLDGAVVAGRTFRASQGARASVLARRTCLRCRCRRAAGMPGPAGGTAGRSFLGGKVAVRTRLAVCFVGRPELAEGRARLARSGVGTTAVAVVPRAARGALVGAVAGRYPRAGIAVPVASAVVVVDDHVKLLLGCVCGWGRGGTRQGASTRWYDRI